MAFTSAGGHATALVDWVNSLEVSDKPVDHVAELADGQVLLRVMHDAAPQLFPGPNAVHLWRLLEGLQTYFSGRHGGGEICAKSLLEQVTAGRRRVDTERVAELVVYGAVETELPEQRRRYIEACQTLSVDSQQGIMAILESFHANEQATADDCASVYPSTKGFVSAKERNIENEEAQLREDRRRWEEELVALRRELEDERERRRSAEEAERVARAELRLADEARERVKDEQRAIFELRLQQEVEGYQEELRSALEEVAQLREELDIARSQAGAAERLNTQLREAKKKLEDFQELKRTNEQLQLRVDELSAGRSGTGAVEHLHGRLEQLRTEALDALAQREAAEHQVMQLTEKLDQARLEHRQAKEEAAMLRRDLQAVRGGNSQTAHSGGPPSLKIEVTDEVGDAEPEEEHKPAAAAAQSPQPRRPPVDPKSAKALPSPKSSNLEELRQLINSKQDDLLEKLLAEKERATKFETTCQLQQEEANRLQDQHRRDTERIATLELQLRNEAEKGEGRGSRCGAATEGDQEKIRELQDLVSQRDRELQVHRWRGRADSEAIHAQEALMVACCHEIGLRYQRLQIQFEALQQRSRAAEERSDGNAVPAASTKPPKPTIQSDSKVVAPMRPPKPSLKQPSAG